MIVCPKCGKDMRNGDVVLTYRDPVNPYGDRFTCVCGRLFTRPEPQQPKMEFQDYYQSQQWED